MPTPTLTPGDNKQDNKLNPGQQHADQLVNRLSNAEQQPGTLDMGDFERNYGENADDPNGNTSIDALRQREANGDPGKTWQNNTSSAPKKLTGTDRLKLFFKKRGALIGTGGGLGIAGIIITSFISPAFVLPSVMQNAVEVNDSRSSILEQRLVQAITQKMGNRSGICDTTKATCRAGKMPKVMLAAMAEKNIVALNTDGSRYAISGNGYVDINPTQYEFTDPNGNKRIVPADSFTNEYNKDPVLRKAFKGAYNMRYLGYTGKYMFTNFFKKFGLSRDGGMAADEDLTEKNAKEKLDEKLKPTSDANSENGARAKFKERIEQLLKRSADKVKKSGGDPILMIGTAACTTINMPGFIAGTYRLIQSAQLILLLNDLILSPAGMQMAGDAKAAQIAAVGTLITEKPASGGGSFMDSRILQSAIGVNTARIAPSKFTPGFSLLTNPTIQGFSQVSQATKEPCNMINSPQAAIGAGAIEGAISVGTVGIGAAVIGALKVAAKVAITFGAIEFAMQKAEESGLISWIAGTAYDMAKDFIGNYVEGARFEELGDATGMAILTYFPTASLAGGAAPLKTSQVEGFSEVMANVENDYKQEAIATLSPFDTSSSYTFLGSMMSDLSLHSVQGNPVQSTLSLLGHIASTPFTLLSGSVSAQESTAAQNCSFASDFGVNDDIAINAAGYPCVGIPSTSINMSRETVMNLVADQIDENSGEPKEDSDIMSTMADCSEGDLESVSGCTISGTAAGVTQYTLCDEDGENCETKTATIPGVDEQKRAAQSLYLFDLQVENILSGQDEIDYSQLGSGASGEYVLPVDPGYRPAGPTQDWGPRSCAGCSNWHRGYDFGVALGKPVYAVADGEVIAVSRANGSGSTCRQGGPGNNTVRIKHADGTASDYLHMAPGDITVNVGDKVEAGQQIGKINVCGESNGAHLHFAIRLESATDPKITSIEQRSDGGIYINPVAYMALYGVDINNGVYTDGR
jgi:hypothetical protein